MPDVPAPIDATQTPEWKALQDHFDSLQSKGISLKDWFAADSQRVQKLSFDLSDLHFDLSKNLVTDETVKLLVALGKAVGLEERRAAMFSGVHINTTEDRAVLHTALRRPASDVGKLIVDGQDCVKDVHEVLDRMYAFADSVRSGEWKGVTGKKIENVVSIGIGGSDLGPVMVYEALKPYADAGISVRYVSNIDPNDMAEKVKGLDPETTLVVIVSKTFTTLETMTNAREARTWLLEGLKVQGAIDGSDASVADAIKKHFVAVSTNLELVEQFGIDPANAFGFWSWVGGRYSVDAAVGLSLIIAFGPQMFKDFLAGFHDLDTYFCETPLEQNVVALMGLINVWYVNFFKAASHAVLPYNQYLHRFPAYLQQLTMESNGKSTRWDGTPVTSDTGEIFWGEAGTNGQHAFYQLIHQGTRMIPADFIAFVNTPNPTKDGDQDVHELFLGNFLAQTKALAFGKTADEVRAEGTAEWMVPARVFTGNRPTTSIFGDTLNAHALGELIALYEHITFVEGTVWGLDSYDQWGVELGKQLAKQITPAFHDDEALAAQDASTKALIAYYRAHRR
ncbi:MAG: glucose-6-phosphate isomerase [Parafannyhessea umbonata]|uniref:glucose-6-phosphate isomerase n=1 Tax=Parafannyhessea umbonata TaxID=604330 RepID=UPI0026EEA708|nr:glucose-6-phosphate isomerase [Parafannyhessea umbonata]MDD6358642.1 glucose-6-phosphate isomerase [Parafannyhessea umbonata]